MRLGLTRKDTVEAPAAAAPRFIDAETGKTIDRLPGFFTAVFTGPLPHHEKTRGVEARGTDLPPVVLIPIKTAEGRRMERFVLAEDCRIASYDYEGLEPLSAAPSQEGGQSWP